MYQPRFRNRNQLTSFPATVLEKFSGTPPTWSTYFTGSSGSYQSRVDYIDDIAGDPPKKSQGLGGYRFHPYTRVVGEFIGSTGQAQWTVQDISLSGVAPNQYHQQFRRVSTGSPSNYQWSTLAFPMLGDRLDFGQLPFPAGDLADLRALAETDVLAKRGKFGESNLFESLAEVDKSLRMLGDILHHANRIQSTMFREVGKSNKLRGLTNELAGLYLMTRYGFKPLVSDISSILVGLEKPLGRMLRTTRSEQKKSSIQTTTLSDFTDSNAVTFTRTLTTQHLLSVRSMSLDSVDMTMFGALGLGIKDFVSVPWELVPYSFVADWFANIGNYLNALIPAFGSSNLGMCSTDRWTCDQLVTYGVKGVAQVGSQTLVTASPPPSFQRRITYTNRTVGTFVPQLRWQSDFKFDSLTRALDAAALFVQRAKGIQQAHGFPSELDKIVQLRNRNPSQKGKRSVSDFANLSD